MTLEEEIQRIKKLPQQELIRITQTRAAYAEDHIAAKNELLRRERSHKFWSQDLVAWLALAVSLLSLVVSLIK